MLPPLSTQAPTLSGTAAEGRLLTAHAGGWSGGSPIHFSFQWLRCNRHANGCAVVAGATSATFRLGGAEVGGRMEARVTAVNAVGSATTPTAASAIVARYRHPPISVLKFAPFSRGLESLHRLLRRLR